MRLSSPRPSRSFLLTLASIATLLLAFCIVNFSPLNRAHSPRRTSCFYHLHVIQGAKQQWELEHKIAEFSPIDPAAVAAYIKGVLPPCPNGGTYRYNAVGIPPQCSDPNHFIEGPDSCASNLRILNDALSLWVSKNPPRMPQPWSGPAPAVSSMTSASVPSAPSTANTPSIPTSAQ